MENFADPLGQSSWLDALFQTGTAGGMISSASSSDPFVRLRQKLSQDRKRYMDKKRAADDAVLPMVIADHKASTERAAALEARIDLALSTLGGQTPPALQQPQLSQGEQYAGALAGLVAPESLPNVLGALQSAAGARSQVEFENALRAYGLTRETAMLGLKRLMGQLDVEQDRGDSLYKTQIGLRDRQAQEDLEAERFYSGQESEIALAELNAADKKEARELQAAMKEMGLSQRESELALKEWIAKNVTKPDTDSKIAKRDADIENAKKNIARLETKDKAQLAIANAKLRAEFGRLTETQKRTILADRALGLTGYNAETGRFNAELRAWEGQVRALGLFDDKDSIWDLLGLENPAMPPVPTVPTAPGSQKAASRPPAMSGNLPGFAPVKPNVNFNVRPEKSKAKGGFLDKALGDLNRSTDFRKKYKY